MADIDVQQFISSSRAKLSEDKIRMLQERTPRGIVPSGSKALAHAAKLRNERQSEYRDYLKTHGTAKSIAEKRREMALERDQELSSHSDTSLAWNRDRGMDYDSLKERNLAEEKRYRHSDGSERPRRKWEDNKPSVTFKQGQPNMVADWDSEEKDLVSWAKQQHSTRRAPSSSSNRSLSAPIQPIRGITTIGGSETDLEIKKNKQKQYADSLRTQMREKTESKQSVQYQPASVTIPTHSQPQEQSKSQSKSQPPEQSKSQASVYYEHKDPPPMREHHYPPYQSMYYPRPPPPPPPHPYYMPSYYPLPPPPGNMYHYPEQPDPYRYHYYPPPANPYLPPHVPAHVTRPREEEMEPRYSRRERDSEFRRSDERVRKSDDPYTSPIHGDSNKGSKGDKTSYRRELERQMREKKERDLKAKIEKEKYDLKQENNIYDPFGKGGCGAPVRDQAGNIVADLKQLKKINDERIGVSPRQSLEFVESGESTTRLSSEKMFPQSGKTILTYNKMDDESQKKESLETYRDFLRRQVKEKEEQKRKQKEAEKLQEIKEMERLERDRKKLEDDLKMDRTRERLTEVELKRKNEELKKEAELRRREYTIKQREMLYEEQRQEKLLAEQKLDALAEKMAQQDNPLLQQQRARSPPIPTLRKQQQQQGGNSQPQKVPQQTFSEQTSIQQTTSQSIPPSSPPVPTLHKKMANSQTQASQRSNSPPVPTIQRKQSTQETVLTPQHTLPTPQPTAPTVTKTPATPATESSILTQLAAMRMHLQAQLAKTQESQSQAHKEPILPPPKAGPRVRQPQSSAQSTNIEKFSSLKYTSPLPNQEFLSQFPNPPRSDSALGVQQGAMLQYQEERLARMRNRKPATTIGGQLPSFSEGVPVSSGDPFREAPSQHNHEMDLLSVNRRCPSVAGRNTSAGGQSQYSIATVDVEGMAGRTEERRRRLDAILNAGTQSRTHNVTGVRDVDPVRDSESIINNFLRRTSGQASGSRGSERSLDCETAYQRLATPNT